MWKFVLSWLTRVSHGSVKAGHGPQRTQQCLGHTERGTQKRNNSISFILFAIQERGNGWLSNYSSPIVDSVRIGISGTLRNSKVMIVVGIRSRIKVVRDHPQLTWTTEGGGV